MYDAITGGREHPAEKRSRDDTRGEVVGTWSPVEDQVEDGLTRWIADHEARDPALLGPDFGKGLLSPRPRQRAEPIRTPAVETLDMPSAIRLLDPADVYVAQPEALLKDQKRLATGQRTRLN
ncbi:hypothetical protein [Solicola gregarius]|uniref:Uncharacterized protein n=1 Tax=Solicola gregarius TaxID=2908642 RepID=A0AA46YPI4_9ACTN|nr:hypothetical protein [Solicola gregarius]UYM07648.1 hypothetical protein L0C25_11425 [Solicola gregarius]